MEGARQSWRDQPVQVRVAKPVQVDEPNLSPP